MRIALYLALAEIMWGGVSVGFRPAAVVQLPGFVDSNSPAVWWNGRLVVFTSDNTPKRSEGADLFHLSGLKVVEWEGEAKSRWIEAAWADTDGTIFAWYHHEPSGVCPADKLTAPMIGAALSYDGGHTFRDLGIILRSSEKPDCSFGNAFFAGGHGDFSVVRQDEYFYFTYTTYGGPPERQGIAFARLPFEARTNPAGQVQKYYEGEWNEPGLDGRATAILQPVHGWQTDRPFAFWGPSVHWNYSINSHVMLLNRSCCDSRWRQEGIYVSFNPDISNPEGWSEPLQLLDDGDWYPQIIGLGPEDTADRAGEVTRFFLRGRSNLELLFWIDEEDKVDEDVTGAAARGRYSVRPVRDAAQGRSPLDAWRGGLKQPGPLVEGQDVPAQLRRHARPLRGR
jgi:hypothetical protein